jgi:hypothetical protein
MTGRQSRSERKHAITESLDMAPSILELLESINPPPHLNFQFIVREPTITFVAALSIIFFLN